MSIDFDLGEFVAKQKERARKQRSQGVAYSLTYERRVVSMLYSREAVRILLQGLVTRWMRTLEASKSGEDPPEPIKRAAQETATELKTAIPLVRMANHALPRPVSIYGASSVELFVRDVNPLFAKQHVAAALSYVQNGTTALRNAHDYLLLGGSLPMKVATRIPRTILDMWSRRALITEDRAAILATRDLHQCIDYISSDTRQGIALGLASPASPFPTHKQRISSLEVFAKSTFYGQHLGKNTAENLPMHEVDKQVADILGLY